MELFSETFESLIRQIYEQNNCNIIATIPIPKGKPIKLIESLKNRPDCKIFIVTKTNRDNIENEIVLALKGST